MTLRLAIIVSHPIQHFAPWHRELAKLPDVDLRVFFCCDWGLTSYIDPEFKIPVAWDIPLVDGYEHEFLPIAHRPERLDFWQVDNPSVGEALDKFDPHVVKIFGYAHRTNWRVARWANRQRKPLMLYSDSNVLAQPVWWKRGIKEAVVRYFYCHVDGAMSVGDNNRAFHLHFGLPGERIFPGVLPIDRRLLLTAASEHKSTRQALRERFGIPADTFVVLFCGKYIERKRPLDLLSATHESAKRGLPIWSLLIGEGPERARMEAFCRNEGVSNSVLTGFVNQSNIPDYYAASDVLAVTSEYDPHPLVVSEAASFGLPIVASDQVGCIGANDTANPGVNALVYACGNREQLSKSIERLYHDRSLFKSMSEASVLISKQQDISIAAQQLSSAVQQLHQLGPR